MIEQIKSLNDKIYELFGEREENKTLLSDEQYKLIGEALFEGYKRELELIKLKIEREFERRRYELEHTNYELIPTRKAKHWWTFWRKYPNRSAEHIENEENYKNDIFFLDHNKILKQLEKDLKAAEEADNGEPLKIESEQAHERQKQAMQPKSSNNQLNGQVTIEELEVGKTQAKAAKPDKT
jgi:hypothetical protein